MYDYRNLDGLTFEHYCAETLRRNGFHSVMVTKASGDDGIDVIAYRRGRKYGIQCKKYSHPVGNKAVQEAYTGKALYKCDIAVVMTNSTFTSSAIDTADKLHVLLWGEEELERLIRRRRPRKRRVERSKRKAASGKNRTGKSRRRFRHVLALFVIVAIAGTVWCFKDAFVYIWKIFGEYF